MSLRKDDILTIIDRLGQQAIDDIDWAEALVPPVSADEFAEEVIFVICNSGMKNTIARAIYYRVVRRLKDGGSAHEVFGHKGKSEAIDFIWKDRVRLYSEYLAAEDKVAYGMTLPWIGAITVYHLVKNFGADVAKPDVHLQRLADREGISPQQLCDRLARETGYRIATIDTLLWRACANGVLNSRTGDIAAAIRSGGGE